MKARIIRSTMLMLILASLPCFVTAAGSGQADDAQATAQATACSEYLLGNGGAFYAPGSYSSWFYVMPPADDSTSAAPQTSSPARAELDLPAYYDYEPRWGPLVA